MSAVAPAAAEYGAAANTLCSAPRFMSVSLLVHAQPAGVFGMVSSWVYGDRAETKDERDGDMRVDDASAADAGAAAASAPAAAPSRAPPTQNGGLIEKNKVRCCAELSSARASEAHLWVGVQAQTAAPTEPAVARVHDASEAPEMIGESNTLLESVWIGP